MSRMWRAVSEAAVIQDLGMCPGGCPEFGSVSLEPYLTIYGAFGPILGEANDAVASSDLALGSVARIGFGRIQLCSPRGEIALQSRILLSSGR